MTDQPSPVWLDGLRLSLGTLTALPVTPPSRVDRPRAAVAMSVAPLAALPLGVLAGAVAWAGTWLSLPGAVVAVLVVAVLALANRGMHLDGLADTADGLAAPKDAEGRLAIMRTGDVGPVGAAALVLVLGVQVAALSVLVQLVSGWLVVGVAVCVSRAALAVVCVRGVPAARGSGLGAAVAGTVPRTVSLTVWVAVGAALALAHSLVPPGEDMGFGGSRTVPAALSYYEPSTFRLILDLLAFDGWSGLVCAAVGVVVVALLVRRAVRAVGGVTGDVCGAAVELCLAAILVALLV
ncbi:adenosylcobinamide-GDP ribazoletransferase [Solicola sp. PLA-1-18]|uniref:adenosylcobinamide-GDP ribazoletransferase n=1 Tax=Solicola sp. PLA-1-18 TaxID=3380532 RepID=UPI003B7B47E3